MIAAPVYVLLGEQGIGVSPSFWDGAVDLCRVVAGLFGLLAIFSLVAGPRRSESSRDGTFGSLAGGVLLIAAAVAGFGLLIVMTGVGGLVLLYASAAMVGDSFRFSRVRAGSDASTGGQIEPFRDRPALNSAEHKLSATPMIARRSGRGG